MRPRVACFLVLTSSGPRIACAVLPDPDRAARVCTCAQETYTDLRADPRADMCAGTCAERVVARSNTSSCPRACCAAAALPAGSRDRRFGPPVWRPGSGDLSAVCNHVYRRAHGSGCTYVLRIREHLYGHARELLLAHESACGCRRVHGHIYIYIYAI